jgi:hypothetical protein
MVDLWLSHKISNHLEIGFGHSLLWFVSQNVVFHLYLGSLKENLLTSRYSSLSQTFLFIHEGVLWWIYAYNSNFLNISKSDTDFHYFDLFLKMSSFTYAWNDQKKINTFPDTVYCIKVVSFILKVSEVGYMAITQVF